MNETTEKAKREATRFALFRRGASTAELALITRQLATLVGAGLTIEEALKAVAEQCEKAHLRSLVATVRSKVVEGYSLADSLGAFPMYSTSCFAPWWRPVKNRAIWRRCSTASPTTPSSASICAPSCCRR